MDPLSINHITCKCQINMLTARACPACTNGSGRLCDTCQSLADTYGSAGPKSIRCLALVVAQAANKLDTADKNMILDDIAMMRVALGKPALPSIQDIIETSTLLSIAAVYCMTVGIAFCWHVMNVWVHYRDSPMCAGWYRFFSCVIEYDRISKAVFGIFFMVLPIYGTCAWQLKRRRLRRRARRLLQG